VKNSGTIYVVCETETVGQFRDSPVESWTVAKPSHTMYPKLRLHFGLTSVQQHVE